MARGQTVRKTVGAAPSRLRVGKPETAVDAPAHTPGVHKGEEWALRAREPGRVGAARTARDATALNPRRRDPIDPRMPYLPPA
ncbi:MAG: hypothetical protein ACRD2E_07080 [Terriglobales bacterium]